jgi:hypothetical protein
MTFVLVRAKGTTEWQGQCLSLAFRASRTLLALSFESSDRGRHDRRKQRAASNNGTAWQAGAMDQVVPAPAPGSRWQRMRRRTIVPVDSWRCRGQKGTEDPGRAWWKVFLASLAGSWRATAHGPIQTTTAARRTERKRKTLLQNHAWQERRNSKGRRGN